MEMQTYNTLYDTFIKQSEKWHDRPAYGAPPRQGRSYHPDGVEFTYAETALAVEVLKAKYTAAGYGHGHRVALLLEQRPELFFHFYALNALGCSIAPINPDYKHDELVYQLEHSESCLAVSINDRIDDVKRAANDVPQNLPVVSFEDFPEHLPKAPPQPIDETPGPATEAALLYTSGTTGRPKGCVLTNEYFHTFGSWYLECGGAIAIRPGLERLYNPLPLHHANALAISASAMLLSGGCHICPDRFHSSTFWKDMIASRITVIHYLGVIPNMLVKQPPSPEEQGHEIRFGLGVGIDPTMHAEIEERFGFPFVEFWAMTETGRIIVDNQEPRLIDTRAFGRPHPGFEARIVDDEGNDVSDGNPGELLVRHSADAPQKGFFSGYLKDEAATEAAWEGGWFHTGDLVSRDSSGMFYFIDRKKNIIRRAGENIAAAEIEAVLAAHPKVKQVAVLAVPDEIREEEVMACVITKSSEDANRSLASELFEYCSIQLAYFKTPGWILFVDKFATTSTQKVQKGKIFPAGVDPRKLAGAIDMRTLKKNPKKSSTTAPQTQILA